MGETTEEMEMILHLSTLCDLSCHSDSTEICTVLKIHNMGLMAN